MVIAFFLVFASKRPFFYIIKNNMYTFYYQNLIFYRGKCFLHQISSYI